MKERKEEFEAALKSAEEVVEKVDNKWTKKRHDTKSLDETLKDSEVVKTLRADVEHFQTMAKNLDGSTTKMTRGYGKWKGIVEDVPVTLDPRRAKVVKTLNALHFDLELSTCFSKQQKAGAVATALHCRRIRAEITAKVQKGELKIGGLNTTPYKEVCQKAPAEKA